MHVKINGGQIVNGELIPSGNKNSIVALIPCSILFDKPVEFSNVPNITDVDRLCKIMNKLGSKIEWDKNYGRMRIDNSNIRFDNLDKQDLGNMKGTSLLWGPMLARFGKVGFQDLPGGCTLGLRPLGPHYDSFKALGVVVKNGERKVYMDATKAFATQVWLPEMSPTITENIIMLATSLKGKTTIIGAASEPNVQEMCSFLVSCGADIMGIGSSVLTINGNKYLNQKGIHEIYPDHHEITTFLALAAATGGYIKVKNTHPELFTHINYIFSKLGVHVQNTGGFSIVDQKKLPRIYPGEAGYLIIRAQPWPGLLVDLLPMFIPIVLKARKGQVLFHNWMYEAGLFWTSELTKLGANIIMADPHRVIVSAGKKLHGAQLEAPYIIRAVVSMVMCALIAEGQTTILNADALYRGHPNFKENLHKLGVEIKEFD
ncbi:MAG: UDP-N-acetylglucosamine 1-carboxyvinyltransferase [Patescibacteria group bacterium]|nr:UDP-N-acetylglucosamine 1-carboxyvinyltransferase [Patescibacteria group bacterium]